MVVDHWLEREDGGWRESARCLQHRLRDRFRVAVDRHLRRNRSNGYVSSTMQNWIQRFHHFRQHSLPSSSTFYPKRVSNDIDSEGDSVFTRMLQAVAVPVIGNVCHVFMHGLNHVQIYGAENLHQAVLNRPENTPLITVSNHVASVDDPLVIASLLPSNVLFRAHNLRWTLCATDRCFRNPVTSAFFKYVKVLPVSRGEGIYQKGMDTAISKLNRGGWVHIFPEGSRSRDGGRTIGSMKKGIARLVLDADNVPVVVPFVHTGMQDIMPIGAKFPRVGKTVTVLIGNPIDFNDLRNLEENEYISRGKLYDAVSARISDRLNKLKAQVDKLVIQQSLRSQSNVSHCADRAAGILQQVDWESLGMDTYIRSDHESLYQKQALQPEKKIDTTYKQDNDSHNNQYFRAGFSYEGGIVSRIRGYMDPTELMGFAARGLFTNQRMKDHFARVQEGKPLKAWSNFWKQVHQSNGIPSNSIFAWAT